MLFGSLQELMDLAHKVEDRNLVAESNIEDFLSRHLKTEASTKWTVSKPNSGWTRVSTWSAPTQIATISVIKPMESKISASEK